MENASREMLRGIIDRGLAWQAALQLPSGAIPMRPLAASGKAERICPYFAVTSALSWLLRPDVYAERVRRYMDWHMAHLNDAASDPNGLDGTIADYTVSRKGGGMPIERVARGRFGRMLYDSSDSYAALFLTLLHAYVSKVSARRYLLAHAREVARIYAAMCGTWNGGLTFARPDWRVQYMMDNCEVYVGLAAAERLFTALHHLTGEARYGTLVADSRERAGAVARALETQMFDANAGLYSVGIDERGRRIPKTIRLRTYYPDAMAQLFAILTGVIPAEGARACALYHRAAQSFGSVPGVEGIIARTAVKMGDTGRALGFFRQYVETVLEAGHADCLAVNCAHIALAADEMLRTNQYMSSGSSGIGPK